MQGEVVKVISNQFYVKVNNNVLICTQRGVLKKNKTLPLVGDKVLIDIKKQVIEKILPRKNEIVRPPVANIDQAIVVTSLKHPDFSTNLLDKLLVQLEINKIKPIICLTKKDLLSSIELTNYLEIINYYQKIGYLVLDNTEMKKLLKELENKITVFLGQTGAGKSTLLNKLFPDLNLKTGEVSLALGRGKHTTRVVEIIEIGSIKVLDTPGFSALSFLKYDLESVKEAFIEFKNYPCLYKDCNHDKEPECNLKKAVLAGNVLESRYENYLNFKKEFSERK
ncbi:MAG: ribosome small subunit-dependent GTPase A [Bacilli bacterium]